MHSRLKPWKLYHSFHGSRVCLGMD